MRIFGDGLKYVPFAVCCALWPDTFFGDGIGDPLCTPSAALEQAYYIYWVYSYSACKALFPSYTHYLRWIIDVIGGIAPAFSAAFLDELHKRERPSSILRL